MLIYRATNDTGGARQCPPGTATRVTFLRGRLRPRDALMCGIIACRTHAPAVGYLLTALRRLEYRGYDSVGVALQTTDGDVVRLRTVGRIGALERDLREWTGT